MSPIEAIRPSTPAEITEANQKTAGKQAPAIQKEVPEPLKTIIDIIHETGSATLDFSGEKAEREAESTSYQIRGHLTRKDLSLPKQMTFTIIETGDRSAKLVIKNRE